MELARASSVEGDVPSIQTSTRIGSIDKIASVLGETAQPTFIEVRERPSGATDLRVIACLVLLVFVGGAACAAAFFEVVRECPSCENCTLN